MKKKIVLYLLSFLLLILMLSCGTRELCSNLSEAEAQKIIFVLQKYGINATKLKVGEGEKATFSVIVPQEDLVAANYILETYHLPKKPEKGLSEIFSSTGIIPTQLEEKAKYLSALQGELAKTLEIIDNVSSARVHIVLPEKDKLSETETVKPSAAVFIKYYGDKIPITEEGVKEIVAHSVPELSPENVAVVMERIFIPQNFTQKIKEKKSMGKIAGFNYTMIIVFLGVVILVLVMMVLFLFFKLKKEEKLVYQLSSEIEQKRGS